MAVSPYYAEYCSFKTTDKTSGAHLIGADSLVGDRLKIVFKPNQDNDMVAWVYNKFDKEVGVFDNRVSRRLQLCQADGWEIHAVLSAVLVSTGEDGGAHYSGEAAVMCFSKRYSEEFNTFLDGVAGKIAEGTRPALSLKAPAIKNVIESHGQWLPRDNEPKRKLSKGEAVVKDHLKQDEKKDAYNPLRFLDTDDEQEFETLCRLMMTSMISECAKSFERLPILLYADILRNVLYSGVWSKYEYIQLKKKGKK